MQGSAPGPSYISIAKCGLSIGLKNDADHVPDLLAEFYWALTEDCFQMNWCEQVRPFIQGGKPVFAAEYSDSGQG